MRRALRHTVLALAAACALGASAPAKADPVTIVTLAAYAASGAGIIAATTAAYIAFGVAIVGGIAARRKAKRAAAAAKDARIASMADRCVTMMTSEPEPNVIYGRCPVGGWVIDKITTPKTYVDDAGTVRTKPDALQHIVIGIACHEVEAIHDVFMYGDWIGTIGADGWVTGGPADAPYGTLHAVQGSRPVTFVNGSATLEQPQQGYSVSKLISISQDGGSEHAGATLAGRAITGGPSSGQWTVTYEISRIKSSLRVEFFRGAPGQTASAYLMSVAPGVWTAAHRLQGIAGAIVTFDLDDGRHQGIPSDLAFDVSGRKVYDPRTGLAAWSRNAALCTYDWMRASWGLRLTTDDVADVVAVANICDQQVSLTIGGVTAVGARYTLDGAFGVNADKSSTLADMLETMGGFAAHGAQWSIHAGAWTEPVIALTDDDLASPIRVVRSHTPLDERMNAAKASYMPERKTKPSDADPYINAAFVAADGGREWGSFTLPFTNNKARARNLLRQFVEQSRAGMIIQYTGKMRLWPLQVGDRVTVTSSRFGLVADTFRVIDWSWAPGQPVALTLQRDIAASYDDADASTADPAPATRLPNPGLVDTPAGLAAASGTEHLLKMSDGTIVPRVLVSWAAPQTIYMSDPSARTRVAWRRMAESTWNDLPALAGNTTSAYLDTVRDRDMIVIRVQHVNSFGAPSTWVAMPHQVLGKTEPPTSPTALQVTETQLAARRYTVTHLQDVDHAGYIVRYSTNLTAEFDQMTQTSARWEGDSRVGESASPLDGTYRFGVAAFDSTGNLSGPAYTIATLSGSAAISGAAAAATAAAAAAAAAQTAANAAQNSATVALTRANAANTALDSIASDSVLSPSEKPEVVQDYTVLTAEQPGIDGQAGVYGITTERAAYNAAITALTSYLGSLPGWNTIPGSDVAIVGADFRAKFAAVYAARQTLLNKISDVAKGLADAAQATGSAAATAAAAARTAANNAQSGANSALNQLAAISSDSILSKVEKSAVILDWTELWGGVAGIVSTANSYSIVSERDAYTGAVNAVAQMLISLAPPWDDTSSDSAIDPAFWRATWDAAYQKRQILLNKISSIAKSLADAAQGSANGAQAAASAAQTAAQAAQAAAAAAQTAANGALGQLQAIASDGVLSRGEKSQVIIDWTELYNGQTGIVATANTLGIVSERDAYTGSVNALAQHLISLSPGWSDTSQDSVIIPATWRSLWDSAYQTRQNLLNRIAVLSSQRADWLSVGNRPANVAQLVGGEDINNAKLGQASNLINCQTEFANNSTAGWILAAWRADVPMLYAGAELARDASGTYAPVGCNPICLAQGAPASGGDVLVSGAYTQALIPVSPLSRVCASAWVACHRCGVDLWIEFKRVDGTGTGGGFASTVGEVQGGRSLSGWMRLAVFADSPADAVAMRLLFTKRNTAAGQVSSYAWMTMPVIERAGSLQTEPGAYSPSAATSHAQLGLIGTGDVADGAATDMLFSHNIGPINVNGYFSSYEIAFINYIVKKTSCPANVRCSFVYELQTPAGFNRSLGPAAIIDIRGVGSIPSSRPIEAGGGSIEYTFPHIIDRQVGVQARCSAGISVISGASIKITDVILTIEAIKL